MEEIIPHYSVLETWHGHLDILRRVLHQHEVDINWVYIGWHGIYRGFKPLMEAVRIGNLDIVAKLLEHPAIHIGKDRWWNTINQGCVEWPSWYCKKTSWTSWDTSLHKKYQRWYRSAHGIACCDEHIAAGVYFWKMFTIGKEPLNFSSSMYSLFLLFRLKLHLHSPNTPAGHLHISMQGEGEKSLKKRKSMDKEEVK